MSTATVRRPPPLPSLIQLSLITLLLVLAAVAWVITSDQMSGMDAGPGTALGSFGFFLGVWVVMMAAMMFPSIVPMVLMQVRIKQGRREGVGSVDRGTTTLFVAGYLVIWAAVGVVAYGIYQLGKAATGDVFAWDNAGPYLAGAILVAAAVYQLTPLKDVCLRHCRSPLTFLLGHWRAGRWGALRMGVVHGAWCVGCCWMLMAALFALGVMSLGWMAFIAALIALEKLLPWRVVANRSIAALLLVLGFGVAFSAENVPGLTLPNSPAAMRAMHAMGMDNGSMSQGHTSGGTMQNGSMSQGHTSGGTMQNGSMSQGHTSGGTTMQNGSMSQGHTSGGTTMQNGSMSQGHTSGGTMQNKPIGGNGSSSAMHNSQNALTPPPHLQLAAAKPVVRGSRVQSWESIVGPSSRQELVPWYPASGAASETSSQTHGQADW